MDRSIVYPGSIPLDTDILNLQQRTMAAIGALVQSSFGTSTFADGLACTQTTVPSLSVTVAQGWLGSLTTLEPNAYGSISADAVTPLMKMGINLSATQLGPMSAPGTAGQSVVYLVQASFSEADTSAVVLPYYNASNPAVPYSGPANAGTSQNTKRAQTVTLQLKQGTATTTGSQTTPAPDSGFTGLYAITIANGATTVVNANIATLPTSPFIQWKLPNLTPGFSRILTFTGSTTWTCPAGVTRVKARVVGGGGGGSGSPGTGAAWSGSGGGAGGYSEGIFTVVPGTVYTITIGAAGAAGAANSTGGAGGTTSFASFNTATGGSGGIANAGGGAGGVGSGGTVNLTGAPGADGTHSGIGNGLYVPTGSGAGGPFGGGGAASVSAGSGGGYGPGSGGGGSYQNTAIAGSAGAAGIIILEY